MFLSLYLAIVQAYICFKRLKEHSHLHSFFSKLASFVLLSLPLLVGFTFPTVTLDSQTVSAKGYYFPLSEGTDRQSKQVKVLGVSISNRIPVDFIHKQLMKILFVRVLINIAQSSIVINDENFLEIMEAIYDYPNEFEGKEIEFIGFVYNDPNHMLIVNLFSVHQCISWFSFRPLDHRKYQSVWQ